MDGQGRGAGTAVPVMNRECSSAGQRWRLGFWEPLPGCSGFGVEALTNESGRELRSGRGLAGTVMSLPTKQAAPCDGQAKVALEVEAGQAFLEFCERHSRK